ncbi:hypothetical protein [Sphingorhabdus sp.]|uniref:hypothetical protein n=1 Tax=Sphingorhabdus sp. TaxID=1902408 RepID=UPI00391C0C44
MADERFIVAIGRIERALSRVEQLATPRATTGDGELVERHERLKAEALAAIQEIDKILAVQTDA